MVERNSRRLDAHLNSVFHALADPTRRAMLRSLAAHECSVGELAAPHRMSLNAASKHIKTLESARLVRRRIEGRNHLCSLDAGALAQAQEWLAFYQRFWTEKLDALERELGKAQSSTKIHPTAKGAGHG